MRAPTAVALLGVLALHGCSSPEPTAEKLPPSPVAYDIIIAHGSPYLDLTIGSARGRFLLDTGANTSGVDSGWLDAARIGSRTGATATVGGTTGNLQVATAVLPRFDLGHGFFERPVFKVQDFSRFTKPGGEPQAGLLGTDFLNSYALELDFEARKATFALRGERAPLRGGTAVPLDYHLNMPVVSVSLAGLSLPCRLDTGAAYLQDAPFLDVNRATVAALTSAGVKLRQRGTIRVGGVGGSESLSLLEAEKGTPSLALTVGPVTVSDVVLVVHGRGTLAVKTPLALAGATMLARWGRITIDPFDRRLLLGR